MADPRQNIPNTNSTPDDWISFHKDLLSVMSQKDANDMWRKFWAVRGNGNDNSTLRDYMKGEGVEIQTGIVSSVYDTASGIVGGIGSTIGNVLGVAKWSGITIGVIILGSITMLLFNIARKPVETLKGVGEAGRGIGAARGGM